MVAPAKMRKCSALASHPPATSYIHCMREKGGNEHVTNEVFGIASFRSRQQVLKFEGALRRAGVRVEVITTPRDVAVGCGLSIRFELADQARVMETYRQLHPSNLIGFYRVERMEGQRTLTRPLIS